MKPTAAHQAGHGTVQHTGNRRPANTHPHPHTRTHKHPSHVGLGALLRAAASRDPPPTPTPPPTCTSASLLRSPLSACSLAETSLASVLMVASLTLRSKCSTPDVRWGAAAAAAAVEVSSSKLRQQTQASRQPPPRLPTSCVFLGKQAGSQQHQNHSSWAKPTTHTDMTWHVCPSHQSPLPLSAPLLWGW